MGGILNEDFASDDISIVSCSKRHDKIFWLSNFWNHTPCPFCEFIKHLSVSNKIIRGSNEN